MRTTNIVVVCIAAILIVAISIYELWLFTKNENAKSWVRVEGQIVQAIWEPKNYRVTYEYVFNGQNFSSSKVSYIRIGSEIKEKRYKQGEMVNVYVNPANHSESVLQPIRSIPLTHYSSTLFVIMGVILLALGIIYGRRSNLFARKQ